ncbi:IS21 family transposase [Alicyclobacillaceae bacterium I2511]|nr:IS21 family transposase [Alicyclobacillaceae bacterium I2511]
MPQGGVLFLANRRLPMRKIREVLYLRYENGLSSRQVGRTLSISHTAVDELLYRFQASGLSWPLPSDLEDATLEQLLYPPTTPSQELRAPLDMIRIQKELRRKGVTLALLWEEYVAAHGSEPCYGYSQFCHLVRDWKKSLDVSMHQSHKAGEKVFLDFAGPTVKVTRPSSEGDLEAQIFVAVLGASNYVYIEACPSQQARFFIAAVCHTLEFIGGVPEALVPDNLRSAVKTPSRYEAELFLGFEQMAEYYHVAVLPARPRHPKDKPAAEKGVQFVETQVLARIRNRSFFSLSELNKVLRELIADLNHKPFQKMEGTRWSLFLEVDKPALRPLPAQSFAYAEWSKAKVASDYHIQVQSNFYSVAYQLAHRKVDVRLTDHLVEIFFKNERVASHLRVSGRGHYSTLVEHLAPQHKVVRGWSSEKFLADAQLVGPYTRALLQAVLESRPYKEQAYRTCRGMLRLADMYPVERMEAAAKRALAFRILSWRSMKSILEKGLDQVAQDPPVKDVPLIHHGNLRGPSYFAD